MTEKPDSAIPPAYTVAFAGEALKDLKKLGPSAAAEILRQVGAWERAGLRVAIHALGLTSAAGIVLDGTASR